MPTPENFCKNLDELFESVAMFKKTCKDKVYFRGHSNANYRLVSSFQRSYIDDYEKCVRNGNEKEAINIILNSINTEKKTYQEFLNANKFDIKLLKEVSEMKNLKLIKTENLDKERSLISFMQHYGVRTRALDFTSNLIVALFFIISGHDQQINDGALWLLNRHMLLELIFNLDTDKYTKIPSNIPYEENPEYTSTLDEALKLYTERIEKLKNNSYPTVHGVPMKDMLQDVEESTLFGKERQSILVENLYSNGLNERICRQSGVFLIQRFVPTSIYDEYNQLINLMNAGHFKARGMEFPKDEIYSPLTKIIISQECFPEIKNFLELVGVNNETLGL